MRNLYPCLYVSLPVSFVTAPAVSQLNSILSDVSEETTQLNSSLAYQTWKLLVGREHGDDGFPADVFM
jgi:hypothetical protein